MAAEGQTSDTERPALSVIEGAGSDNQLSSDATHKPRVAGKVRRKTRTASKQAAKTRKDDAVVLTNELVISSEQVSELRGALIEFTKILNECVQEQSDTTSWSEKIIKPYMELVRMMSFQRFFSSSIYGRQLTRNELVGEYANLWPALEQPFNLIYAEAACLGARALKAQRLEVAQSIIEDLKFATSTPVALSYVMRGIMRFVVVAGFLLYFLAILALGAFKDGAFTENIQLDFASSEPGKVLLAAVFGCLGGVVSLLMRLSEFETTKGRSRQFLVLSGTTLPIVGGIFAAVIASLLASKIINFGTSGAEGLNAWLFIVIGFLAGFSERFTRNLLSIAENQFSRSSGRSDPNRPKAGARLPN
jgi:hypothetical protein